MAYSTPQLLSDRGRAWLGSVEGVPPQQLPAHAEMAAKTGLMPFQDALMIKQMADQIRASAGNEPPPPDNVMEQKLAMISGRAPPAPPQQMPPPQQMGGEAAPPQQDPRMQGGLGTLSAPNMNFAGGGIVAFAGRDSSYVGGSDDISPEQIRQMMQSPVYQRLLPMVIRQESGGNPNAVSPKGARGRMQVMDATNIDPGFGVMPARDNSPEERERVGREYFAALLVKYNGNAEDALAAYNDGPADHDKTIAGERRMPAETSNYVRNITGNAAGAAGAAPRQSGESPATQARVLQTENDRRAIANVTNKAAIPFASIADQLVSTPWNLLATGVERGANAIGIPRAGRALGIYDPDVTHITMPKIGNGDIGGFPLTEALKSRIRANQPLTVAPPPGQRLWESKPPPAAPVVPPKTAAPPPAAGLAGLKIEETPDKPLLTPIDVEAEMKKRGMTDEEKYLARARAGFAAAAQRGNFGDKFATFGSTLAEGLGGLKAADRKTRAELEDMARKREETNLALGLKVRELDQTGAYNRATSAARRATARAALLKAKGDAIEKLMMQPGFREQYEMSLKKGHPSQADAKAYVDYLIQQQIGDIDFTGLNDEDGGMTVTPYAGT